MSQGVQEFDSLDASRGASASRSVGNPASPGSRVSLGEFDYRPVPVVAPVALVFGVCSAIALLSVFALAVPLAGVMIGTVAVLRIRGSEGEYGGGRIAAIGLLLSTLFLVAGGVLHGHTIATEVPEGHARVNFTHDISRKGFVVENGRVRLHEDVKALDGRKVFLKGYMYPTGQTEGLKSFILVKDNQQCCFGGQPKLTDMILVRMQDGATADYHPSLVAVAGVFRTRDPALGGNLSPVYRLEATDCELSRTPF